jgi:hypothetical protein
MTGFFKATPTTELLVLRLKDALASGEEFISYEDLNAVAEMDVQVQPGYGYLLTARSRVQDEESAVWECERGKGLYLMPTTERCGIGKRTVKRVRRQVRKGEKILDTVDLGDCKEEDLNKFNTSATIIGALKHLSQPKVVRRIEGEIEKGRETGALPLDDALDMVKKANRRQTRD